MINHQCPIPLGAADRQQRRALPAVALCLLAGTLLTGSALAQDKERAKGAQPAPRPIVPTVQPTGGSKAGPGPATPAPAGGAVPSTDLPIAIDDHRPPPPPGTYRFPAFSEPIDVVILVDMVAERLKIQLIATDVALREKKINLRTSIDVKEEDLLHFLQILLEQVGQYITKEGDIYFIKPANEVGQAVGNDMGTTQVIPTKGLRPSSLNVAINNLLRSTPGAAPGQTGQAVNVSFLDDLGVMVITDTPRRIDAVRALIDQLAAEQIDMPFTRFEIKNLSANVARQRMLEMLGSMQRPGGQVNYNPNDPNAAAQQAAMAASGAAGSSSNLAGRLVVDSQGNALVLRGHPEEVELISRLLIVIDVPNQLVPKWYAVGPAAQALAEQGRRAGLGEITVMQASRAGGNPQNPGMNGSFYLDPNGNPVTYGQNQQSQIASGPVFVLDADQRGFIYYGTPEQHQQLAKLVGEFEELTKSERIVYEFYKLKFADAEKTAELIRGMLNNTVPGGEAPLIPGAGTGGTSGRRNTRGAALNAAELGAAPGEGAGGLDQIIATEDVHVLPDKANNQIIVKAPQRMQPQFQRLIERVDLKRAQVYIDAKIIVVSNKNDFTLAVETQLANTASVSGALRTSFGLSTIAAAAAQPVLAPAVVGIGSGLTTAIIKSDQVPLIINAVQTDTNGRILASPQLLVDDNEEAELSSITQEPTTTTTIGVNGAPNTQTFNGYQEAGPKLKVKPRISTGDMLSIEYTVELSSFTGAGAGGIPPPRTENKVTSKSVSIPSDSTILVGGLTLRDARKTVVKVPFIGDIPLIGDLMKKTNTVDDERTVYILITPRIMRDPLGNDLRLISRGPMADVRLNPDLPPVKPELITNLDPHPRIIP